MMSLALKIVLTKPYAIQLGLTGNICPFLNLLPKYTCTLSLSQITFQLGDQLSS